VPLQEWRAVTTAFVGVLLASVRVLNNDQPDIGEDQEFEHDPARDTARAGALARQERQGRQGRQGRVVRRLSGGIRAFLIAPDEEEQGEEAAQAQREAQKRRGKVPQKSPTRGERAPEKSPANTLRWHWAQGGGELSLNSRRPKS